MMKSRVRDAVVLCLGGLLSFHVVADNARNVEDVLLRQQWQDESGFLTSWTAGKTFDTENIIKNLVNAHTLNTVSGPALRPYPSKDHVRSKLNKTWIDAASYALFIEDYPNVKAYLAQVLPPLSEDEQLWYDSLTMSFLLANNDIIGAETLLDKLQNSDFFTNIFRVQENLALIEAGRIRDARQLSGRIRSDIQIVNRQIETIDSGLSAAISSDRTRVPDSFFAPQHQLPVQKADISLHQSRLSGDSTAKLFHLLGVTSVPAEGRLDVNQVNLADLLSDEGAQTQLLDLANRWMTQLLAERQRLVRLKTAKLNQEIPEKVAQARVETLDTRLLEGIGEHARWQAEEVARINNLISLMVANSENLKAYLQLMDKGSEYMTEQLRVFPDLLPPTASNYPEYVVNQGEEVLLFERLLSRFIGTPPDWELRYVYLDGLSRWYTGKPFRNAWWQDPNYSIRSATIELRRLMTGRQELINQLSEQRWDVTENNIRGLVARTDKSLNSLQTIRRNLLQTLEEEVIKDFDRRISEVDRQIIWLAWRSLPTADQIDSNDPVPFYQLNRSGGQVSLSQSEQQSDVGDISQILSALNTVAQVAGDKNTQLDAATHLAGLTLEIAEIQSFTAVQSVLDIDVDIQDAITYFQLVSDSAPAPEARAAAIYQLARAYQLDNQNLAYVESLERLLTSDLPFERKDEVLFRVGDSRFSLEFYDLSAAAYQTLVDQYPESAFYDNANYMLGWSYFKQAEYRKALDQFFGIVDENWFANSEEAIDQRLISDTMRVIGMTFANMNGAASVRQFFSELGPKPYAEKIYADLGQYYEDRLRYTDAADTYESMMALYLNSDRAPYYQSRVVKAYTDGEFPSRVWPAKEQFVDWFGRDSEQWINGDEAKRNGIMTYLPGYLADLAKRAHAQAQASEEQSDYLKAIDLYQHFIDVAAQLPGAAEMFFLKGEAQTEIGEHQRAAESYMQAAYGYPDYENADESGYSALLSYQRLYNAESGAEKDKWLELGISESHRFVANFIESDFRPLVQTKLAEDMLLRLDYTVALRLADDLLATATPEFTDGMKLRLWRVAGHANYELEQYKAAEIAYAEAIKLTSNGQEASEFTKRRAETIYRQGEQAQAAGQYSVAADQYLRLGREYPESDIRANAEFDAATVLILDESWERARDVLEGFRKLYPEHNLKDQILEKQVVVYENTEEWAKASVILETIYQREGDSPLGQNALWRSASLQEKAGNSDKAIALFKQYLNEFPSPLEPATEARYELFSIYDKRDDNSRAEFWLAALLAAQQKQVRESSPRVEFLASEASLRLGRNRYDEFNAVKLTLPLNQSLSRKQNAMESAIKQFNTTLSYGIAEHSTEATARMATLYLNLAKALLDSDRPAELNALELEQYELLLEEQVFPFEDKALELYEVNVGWIRDDIYTDWVQYSLDQLTAILPARYNKPEVVPEYVETIQ